MRFRETQQRAFIVVAFAADAGEGLGQSVCVKDQCVAGREVEPAGNEVRCGNQADGVATDAVHVVGAEICAEQQWGQVASAGKLDIKSVVPLG